MPTLNPPHEQQLADIFTKRGEAFTLATAVIEQLCEGKAPHDPTSARALRELQSIVEKIRSFDVPTEATIAASRGGQPLNAFLQTEVSRQQHLLENCLSRVNQLMSRYESMRQALLPQIDTQTKRRQMQTAYHRSLRGG